MFLPAQPKDNQKNYVDLLTEVGRLSRLFSQSKTPYLYYRAHENIFCLTLEASNESRGDVSVDAVSGTTGIGLKTFVFKNSQYEKVAEFNKLLATYRHLSGLELVKALADARNDRLNLTSRTYNLESILYHCIARKNGKFVIYEESMDLIEIESIAIDEERTASIDFHDSKNYYRFNFSKSTLFKKFEPADTVEFEVDIIDDPFTLLLKNKRTIALGSGKAGDDEKEKESVVLPLYSLRGDMHVPEGSGLNQWNASGRKRDDDEVYIPIPSWIHEVFPDFFPPRDQPFDLVLPGNKTISAKVCQENSKALMSNPNKELGGVASEKSARPKAGDIGYIRHAPKSRHRLRSCDKNHRQ